MMRVLVPTSSQGLTHGLHEDVDDDGDEVGEDEEDTGGGRQDIFGTYSQQECGRKREVGDEVSVERETLLSSDFESQAKKDDSERDRKTV